MPITKGTIIRVAGAVLDLRFTPGEEPAIHALVTTESGSHHMEVFSHLGDGVVRCVALEATEGLRCGLHVESDGTADVYKRQKPKGVSTIYNKHITSPTV